MSDESMDLPQNGEHASQQPIRVMLVDDHAVVRSGLIAFLLAYEDLDLVGEASDGEEAVRLCARVLPDVVLMDLIMPRMDGTTATRLIRAEHPEIPVIALTSSKDEEMIQNTLRAGAIGYLLKNVSADDLVNAIRAAHHGRPTLAPEATHALIHSATQTNYPPVGHDLTEREREVLALMAEGMNNSQIAEKLVVSRSTVKFHVSSILSKLHVSNRTEAVVLALQQHLVGQPPNLNSENR
mgnify:CR=1 FL=1